MLCWMCNKETGNDSVGDHNCPNCGVLVSTYDKDKPDWLSPTGYPTTEEQWLKAEEDMPIPKEVRETTFAAFVKLPNIVDNKEGEVKVGDKVEIASVFDAPASPALKSPLVGDVLLENGQKRALGLNWTSYYEIAKVLGKNTDEWVGKKLTYQGMKKCGRGALGHIWTAI